jgi:tRNA (guanine26-N2/guanine27-N2)-dimethyltransferase
MFIEEGLVKVKIPEDYLSKKHFFNPRMELARDLTILILHALNSRNWIVCDALAGIGIRGIRIAKECEVEKVWLNDISKDAISFMKKNVVLNRVKSRVKIFNEDAKLLLIRNKRTFDYIDIDPFGSPSYFFDACAEAIKRKGLLGFSATDTAPLSGVNPLTCFRRYGTKSYRTDFFKELGLRILIGSVALSLSKYFLYFEPILSYSSEHYYRVWGRVEKKRSKTNESLEKNLGFVSYCSKCLWRRVSKEPKVECGFCNSSCRIISNVWVGKIEDLLFIDDCLKELSKINWLRTRKRIQKLLTVLKNETIPFYYDIHKLCQKLELPIPSFKFLQDELRKNGFKAERTHFSSKGIKTNASLEDLIKTIKLRKK